MAYRISYDGVGKYRLKNKNKRKGIYSAVFVLLLVFVAISIKVSGLTWVQEVLLPGDSAVTAAALEDMVTDLRNGDSLYEAIKAFCQEIVEHAGTAE